jgi:hypothetical protein
LVTEFDAGLIAEAQSELARYLSDEIAPMIFAGSAEVLFNTAPENMARGIHSWVSNQLQGPVPSPVTDYLLHSARKVHQLGELELIPRSELRAFLAKLSPLLISICPEADRADLTANLNLLGAAEAETSTARISVGRSPSSTGSFGAPYGSEGAEGSAASGAYPPQGAAYPPQGRGDRGASRQLERAPDAPAHQPEVPSTAAPAADVAPADAGVQIDRLNMLLDRWERLASSSAPAQAPNTQAAAPDPDAPETASESATQAAAPGQGVAATPSLTATLAGAESALLSRIIDEVASTARSSNDLNNQLKYLNSVGIADVGSGVFRALSGALPDWAPAYAPSTDEGDAPPLSGAAETMKKVVALAKDPSEVIDRFRELISTAVEEFNNGSLGRSVTVVDLAQRMLAQKEIDPSLGHNIIHQAAEKLDHSQLSTYAENDDKKLLLRRLLSFFPPFQIHHLMEELMVEERRDRRRLILRLLMIHGNEARGMASKILDESLSGDVPQPWYVQRNLIYLMRSIPPSEEFDIDKEIDLLVRASVPGGELPLLREALTALGQIDHPRAEKTLVARVSDLEDLLMQKSKGLHRASEVQSLLDTAIKAMIRFDSKEVRQCVVTHGLSRRPELGDTHSRLAMLGGQSLADDPRTISRIVEAIQNELPVKVFGVSVKSSKKAQKLDHLLESLSGTDIPKVRKVYDSIVRKFAGERFANSAAKYLTKLGSGAPLDEEKSEGETITSLSGDLSLFGLPNLMQNLADSRVEGVLTVLDDAGSSTAMVVLSDGMMIDATVGELNGETAVYQLLERPILGRFIFVNQPVETPAPGDGQPGKPVMSLLMEGMRRYDEFNRAAAIVPEDGQFAATGSQPTGLPDEDDPDFVNGIWVQASQGTTPREIETTAKVDGYRIFRLFEHWLQEGALELKS